MSINNFQPTVRRLSRQKLNTALHIAGLTLGMSVCLLIGLFLRHELGFDTWQSAASRIYRINHVETRDGEVNYNYSTHIPLAEAMRTDSSWLTAQSL
ncbi:MAG: hypothetical protein QM768_19470 [Agriterribacter sp.]